MTPRPPVLGYETSRRVMEALPLLAGYELHYSGLSILEALWKISKRLAALDPGERRDAMERIREGLDAITTGMNHATVTAAAAEKALEVYLLGHRDMVDNLLYTTAAEHNLTLLTIDNELVDFTDANGLPADHIITPEELKKRSR